ncbi:MAG: hypothetical protein SOZ23_01905 [Methanosphaera sp.]|uniref:hypothetical protein n=1 Tax=Methanosphaera sp. TaxID=2666342 RepID=UPI0025F41218|nr:hypothetical protein [Methanosphaera sp.]MCI5867130.1 hypothetical protein [Methanosphaera sp.]MDD6534801.1 hypothetical protein [Methanosphaera sp.]MDY3955531.1 hypothetical protein [Methanosphaera sp.]
MNVKELLGIKIIDKNGKEVAKVADLRFDVKTYNISAIYGSAGNPISKKYYEVDPASIIAMGEYLLISQTIEELEETVVTKIPTEDGTSTINQGLEKTVIDKEGNIAGKITNIEIEKDPFAVTGIIVEKAGGSFGKPKAKYSINKEDITTNGDYVILNKVIEEPKEEEAEEADAEADEE